jgi:hypothetical protein
LHFGDKKDITQVLMSKQELLDLPYEELGYLSQVGFREKINPST